MSDDTRFTPRPGRIGDHGSGGGKRFTRRVLRRAARMGRVRARRQGSNPVRMRGAAAARLSSIRPTRFPARQMRRVVVQVHIAPARGTGGAGAFRAHVRYLQRDGVDREGREGELYDRDRDGISDLDFLERGADDRHQFRIMVSPEDGAELGDLKPHIRAYMEGVEKDLCTRLDWVAVDHHNTGQPHTHIIVRGRAGDGTDLVIDRDYLTKGLRQRASDLVTEALGPRRELEILRAQARDVSAERFTRLDRGIEAAADNGQLRIPAGHSPGDRFERALQLRRLRQLRQMGLAHEPTPGQWSLRPGWTDTLKEMGRRGDIVRTLQASLAGRDLANRFSLYRADDGQVLSGRVVGHVPRDELRGTRLLLVDGTDGRSWGVELAPRSEAAIPTGGTIVEIGPRPARARASDRTIARVAALQDRLWSEARHTIVDPAASAEYRLAHKRRLEALRRAGIVKRLGNGDWQIGPDYLERAAEFEARNSAARVIERTGQPLSAMQRADALTWLDDLDPASTGETGFGGEVRRAIAVRQNWLRETGRLAPGEDRLSDKVRASLRRSELQRLASAEAKSTGREPVTLSKGDGFDGRLERRLDTHQGPMALVGNETRFTLIRWKSSMGAALGRDIALTRKGPGIDWTMGRRRGLSL